MKAIIFGATGGIGSEIAQTCAERGWDVIGSARQEERLKSLSSLAPDKIFYRTCDVTQPQEIERVYEAMPDFDAVCLSVGSLLLKPAHLTSDEEWHNTVLLNLTSAFFVLKIGIKFAAVRQISFVFFSSVAARLGLPNHEAIAAAKAGVEGLVRSAAASYASRGIRVNAIAPGLVDTPLTSRITANPAALESSQAMHPLGRIGKPKDIAETAVWLMSPASSWVTGQVIRVDGGMSTVRAPARRN